MLLDPTLPALDVLILSLGAVIAGVFILVKGGNWTIDGGVSVANRFNMPPALIGFAVIAFGTSLPELVVSVNANMKGFPGLSIGNVVGSNVANILLIVGISALFAPIVATLSKHLKRDFFMLIASSLVLAFALQRSYLSQIEGGAMFGALLLYVIWQYRQSQKDGEVLVDNDETKPVYETAFSSFFFLILGLIGVALGAEILVRGAVVGATILGIPEGVIGLTIVAFGTSLPELVTCVIAVRKNHNDIVIGNVVGSCVFNILTIIGITALVSGINLGDIDQRMAEIDVWVMTAIAALFVGYLAVFKKITKTAGIVMTLLYVIFTIEQYMSSLS